MLTTLSSGARIQIGQKVGLSGVSLCALQEIYVGDGVVIGADTLITDTDHHPIGGVRVRHQTLGFKATPIWIGSGAFIGARAIILKGARIGSNAVVGAGAVLSGEVPPYAIAAGNPARIVGWVNETGPGEAESTGSKKRADIRRV
jgi:acetyltransferase-like isoleucine patch superfamily enzyme